MFERMSNGWALTRQSWRVLMLDKELLLFPLISGFCCLLVLGSFAAPLYGTGYFETVMNDGQIDQQALDNPLVYVVLFAFYFVNYFVIIFFNSALIACAIIRFQGGNPTLSDGLSAASKRLPQIVAWALVSATVGLILKIIESRSKKVGQIVAGLLGAVWSIATYFVVPVLVVEKAGPVDAFKRSTSILRKSWGEALVSNFGIGLLTFIPTFLAFLVLAGGIFAIVTEKVVLGVLLIVCALFSILLISLISATLNSIVIAALYLFAAQGKVPEQMDRSLLENAFANRG